ncbi:MAG TPA: GNAT family N-acetyltransferase [Candidatus Polarisedimenticolaceae bacterium]|nr:GNAT family N-acetyltransferase [Candidatus Polarisedimenticolaceae bacterium]
MPSLAVASLEQIRAIYRESYRLWGGGLSPGDYYGLWEDLQSTAWGRRYASFLVWVDGRDRILSSLKVYRPEIRLYDRIARGVLLGAIFTPSPCRGRGHAAAMVRAVLDQARARGDGVALLFSDIGAGYYARLGFTAMPAEEHWGSLPADGGPEGWTLREATAGDAETLHAAHCETSARRGIAILRDAPLWEFLAVRSQRFFDRLNDPTLGLRTWVGVRAGNVLGYAVAVEGRGEWSLRELAARDGDPGVQAQLLKLGALEARRRGMRRFYGWLPRELAAQLAGWRLRCVPRRRALPMVLPLQGPVDLTPLASAEAAYFPYQDQF